jgi:hypothetical protein
MAFICQCANERFDRLWAAYHAQSLDSAPAFNRAFLLEKGEERRGGPWIANPAQRRCGRYADPLDRVVEGLQKWVYRTPVANLAQRCGCRLTGSRVFVIAQRVEQFPELVLGLDAAEMASIINGLQRLSYELSS